MSTAALSAPYDRDDRAARSVFLDADICAEASLPRPGAGVRPMFGHDIWDFTGVAGLPIQLSRSQRRFDFATIDNPRWRTVAKELMLALLCPRHPAVAVLPRAHRTALSLRTCQTRLSELARLLNWLTAEGLDTLEHLRDEHCAAYLTYRGRARTGDGQPSTSNGPGTLRIAAQAVIDLVNYRELFTTDRVSAQLRPFSGVSSSAAAGLKSSVGHNKTPPLGDRVLQPMLAAATYLLDVLGAHVAVLAGQARDHTHAWALLPKPHRAPIVELTAVLERYRRDGAPLPRIGEHDLRQRLANGWQPNDPVLPVSLHRLAYEAGYRDFFAHWLEPLRHLIEQVVAITGVALPWGRQAAEVASATGQQQLPWTPPLHRLEVIAVTEVVRTAAIIMIAAVSGMRASELMELTASCQLPVQPLGPGLTRYRLASTIIKGQPLGGLADEWVVIEPVYQAAGLALLLLDRPAPHTPLFGRLQFASRYLSFRNWVNGPAGKRLELAPIPDDHVTLRMLRRTLAMELGYRPNGLFAAKIHLKHVSVATTEGYTSRPGGAQARLLAEINQHEADRNLALVLAEYRDYQQGRLPAGPGARELTQFFAQIDAATSHADASEPKVQRSDRDVLNLLSKRASTLHVGPANYCWFSEPSRALCLKLAGTPTADRPLIGMCDSARCPQATHHPHHRAVWAEHAQRTKTFLGELGPTRKTEKARLQADYNRARRVLDGIDNVASDSPGPE